MHIFVYSSSLTLGGISVGLYLGYLYTLFVLFTIPFVFTGMGAFIYIKAKSDKVTKENYMDAGATAEEALSSIKTVYSLSG